MRLNAKNQSRLPAEVACPAPADDAGDVGIVHIGVGAFHRAHQAVYTDDLLQRSGGGWRIAGVSMQSSRTRDRLRAQDYLYSVTEQCGDRCRTRVVRSIARMYVYPEQPHVVRDLIASPTIHVVTLTITEKGYGLGAHGQLDEGQADVSADLAWMPCQSSGKEPKTAPKSAPETAPKTAPKTAPGLLAWALLHRMQNKQPGLTLISCDNLVSNGSKLQSAVLAYCRVLDRDLPSWVEQHCCFPATVVDRIVPATTADQVDALEERIGLRDEAAVFCEPYRQWLIEKKFAGPVPHWEQVGAQFVDDVGPFEDMKLRLLNASHSLLAWVGVLAGIPTISQAMTIPTLRALIELAMSEEASPSLRVPADFPLAEYRRSIVERFSNPSLSHTTLQIAGDSSEKITQRWLPILLAGIADKRALPLTSFALACWRRVLDGHSESGNDLNIRDPNAPRVNSAAQSSEAAILEPIRAVLGSAVDDEKFCEALVCWYQRIARVGVLMAAEEVLEQEYGLGSGVKP